MGTVRRARSIHLARRDAIAEQLCGYRGWEPAGFSDVDPNGYIDMMFVAPRFHRRGVAKQLLAHVETHMRAKRSDRPHFQCQHYGPFLL
ncbi:GNAT family N-acetyltransferase [Arthrobacter psychrolactophilus]|uniref:GNAT family N-acetyltransferase n=1 Tax=Arthrobacter psychrolactophilus TaxID=92442 RepID=UPI0027960814|nr:GNAT family N-acetyltransferase [Arthrobacter psychrolactophilus]